MTSKTIYGCIATTSNDTKFHYVYRITNIVTQMHYYGVRSCKCLPHNDIGTRYFSSSLNKLFKIDQKNSPQNYKYKILAVLPSRIKAEQRESKLHALFNVMHNNKFYNLYNATGKFLPLGRSSYKDGDGNTYWLSVNDPMIAQQNLVGIATGMAVYVDVTGNKYRVSSNDERVLSGELKHHLKGLVKVKDHTGRIFTVSMDDPRYISKELVHMHTNKVNVKDKSGNRLKVSTIDPRFISGELTSVNSGMGVYKDSNNNIVRIPVYDDRVLSKEVTGIHAGKKFSEEHCKNISTARMGHVVSDETKQKISKTTTGKRLTEDHIQNLKRYKKTDEHRKNLSKKGDARSAAF